jgi:16S rRNA (guanine527-N7)-methyltransferase
MIGASEQRVGDLSVSRETFDGLTAFEAMVRKWTPAINLISKSTVSQIWERHILDSAQLMPLCPEGALRWVDLGSGGGFPGVVVAILAKERKPEMETVLVESDQRKAAFLRHVVQSLKLKSCVRSGRIESLEPEAADVVSARALAPLGELLGLAARHLRPDGLAILPKGSRHADELVQAGKDWAFDAETLPSRSEAGAAILVIRKIKRAEHS